MTKLFGSESPQLDIDDFITDAQEPVSDDDDDDIWLDFARDPPFHTFQNEDDADIVLQECWPN